MTRAGASVAEEGDELAVEGPVDRLHPALPSTRHGALKVELGSSLPGRGRRGWARTRSEKEKLFLTQNR